MILHYREVYSTTSMLNNEISSGVRLQRIRETAFYLVMRLRQPGRNVYWAIGKGHRCVGLWRSDEGPGADLRTKSPLSEYLRSHWEGAVVKRVSLDPNDRIVYIDGIVRGDQRRLGFFWKGRELFIADQLDGKTFCSWNGQKVEGSAEHAFNSIGRRQEIVELGEAKAIKEFSPFEWESQQGSRRLGLSQQKKLKKKMVAIEQDLRRMESWIALKPDLIVDKLDLSATKFQLSGITVKFGAELSHGAKRNMVFEKIKRLESAIDHMRRRYQLARSEYLQTQQSGPKLQRVKVVPRWGKKIASVPKATPSTTVDAHFLDFNGIPLGIGKSAAGNDHLRTKWASRAHYWFHIEGVTSAHGFAKTDQVPSPDLVEFVGRKLAELSKFSDERIPIIYTQVKNLRAVPGKSGLVRYTKVKYVMVLA